MESLFMETSMVMNMEMSMVMMTMDHDDDDDEQGHDEHGEERIFFNYRF